MSRFEEGVFLKTEPIYMKTWNLDLPNTMSKLGESTFLEEEPLNDEV
jgi:hypothetical protein